MIRWNRPTYKATLIVTAPREHPRPVMIVESFSNDLERLTRYVNGVAQSYPPEVGGLQDRRVVDIAQVRPFPYRLLNKWIIAGDL